MSTEEHAPSRFEFTDAEWCAYQNMPQQGFSHRGHLELVVNRWLDANVGGIVAKAWEEGAEAAWQTTGEGANAEYPGNDGAMTWREYTNEITNPYRTNGIEEGK